LVPTILENEKTAGSSKQGNPGGELNLGGRSHQFTSTGECKVIPYNGNILVKLKQSTEISESLENRNYM
jgi:hypothetical protein